MVQRTINNWMLWRDRRAMIAAIAIFAAYTAMVLSLAIGALVLLNPSVRIDDHQALFSLASGNLGLLVWRLGMRGWFSGQIYGWKQGLLAVVRQPVSNFILMLTASRALISYWKARRGAPTQWDKTDHSFPSDQMIEDSR